MNLTTHGEPWPGAAMAELLAGERGRRKDCGEGLERKGEGTIEPWERVRTELRAAASSAPLSQGTL